MITHIKVLGILHIVMGGFLLLVGLGFLIFFGGLAGMAGVSDHSRDNLAAIPILGGIGAFLFVIIAALSIPGIVTGIGLLQLRPWGRIMGIILSALHLFNIPFGTVLGVYGLWALLNPEAEALFRRDPLPLQQRF